MELPKEFEYDDPYLFGQGEGPDPNHAGEGDDVLRSLIDALAMGCDGGDNGEFDDVPYDIVEDILEAAEEAQAIPNERLAPDVDDAELANDEEDLAAAVLAIEEAAGSQAAHEGDGGASNRPGSSSDPPAAPGMVAGSVDDAIAHTVPAYTGHFTCPVAPWNTGRNVGRITVWDKADPLRNQNVAIRCYMHTGCSWTRKRIAYTDNELLRWLYEATPLAPTASDDDRQRAKAQHARDAKRMLNKPAAKAK